MRAAASLLALSTVGCDAAAANEDQFRDEMLARMSAQQPEAAFKIGDEPLVIKVSGGSWEEGSINLHRIYQFCLNASAKDCETAKQEFVEKTKVKPVDITAPSLRIAVRDSVYVGYIEQLEAKSGKRQAIRRQIGEDLFAILVSDGPDTIALVPPEELADLKLTESDAWDRAWRQTQSILPKIPSPESLKKTAAAFESKEYLASIAADLPQWQLISDALGPNLFLTAVSDQFVFAGLLADGPDFEDFRKSVEEDCLAQQRCISPHIYRFRKGRWTIAR